MYVVKTKQEEERESIDFCRLYYTHESKGIKRRKKEIRKKPKN
jgi:hypothetical protein